MIRVFAQSAAASGRYRSRLQAAVIITCVLLAGSAAGIAFTLMLAAAGR